MTQDHQLTKDQLLENSGEIELIQSAIISGVSSLFYSEYISRIVKKAVPVGRIHVPEISTLKEYLNIGSEFMSCLSKSLLNMMLENNLLQRYIDARELILFKGDIVSLKTILSRYILPNLSKTIPSVISNKFQLNNPKQQLIIENRGIDIFDRQPINEYQYDFIVNESVLHLLLSLPSITKVHYEWDISGIPILLSNDNILTIDHDNAICPIHINPSIFNNPKVFPLISFVTSTQIDSQFADGHYEVISNPNNRLSDTVLRELDKEPAE